MVYIFKQKTHEYFCEQVFKLHNGEYEVLSIYMGHDKKITIKHLKCNHIYETTPHSFLKGLKCKKCMGNLKITNDEFVECVHNLVKDEYMVLSEYNGLQKHVKIKHLICGLEYHVTPTHFLHSGSRCPKCNGGIKKLHNDFVNQIFDLVGDEYTVVGKYINADTKIMFRHNCDECNNYSWEVKPVNFISNTTRCPVCLESKGENRIRIYLQSNNIEFTRQKQFDDLIGINFGNLSYDFYLKDYNMLIEYQGNFHDGTVTKQTPYQFQRQQEHDARKREYAKSNNIELLEIWYWDFGNIEDILTRLFKL